MKMESIIVNVEVLKSDSTAQRNKKVLDKMGSLVEAFSSKWRISLKIRQDYAEVQCRYAGSSNYETLIVYLVYAVVKEDVSDDTESIDVSQQSGN